MKQVLQHARTGEITVEEVPPPQLLPGCVLVRIAASVVSAGTERASAEFARKSLLQKAQARPDLVREVISKVRRDGIFSAIEAVRSRLDQPQSPGYSSAGTVIAVGEGVTDLQPCDRVACAGAGFALHAEIACVPRLLVARIPPRPAGDEVPFDEAAFATLGAVALHGIRNAEAKLGDLVAVIGLGLLGQLTVQLLKAAGCRVLGMDLDPVRADLAQRMGADGAASLAAAFRDLCTETSRGAGVDSVLITAETSSSDPVNLAGAIARDRAIVVAVGTVGMDIERKAYYEKELDFRVSRSYGPGRYDAAYEQKGRDSSGRRGGGRLTSQRATPARSKPPGSRLVCPHWAASSPRRRSHKKPAASSSTRSASRRAATRARSLSPDLTHGAATSPGVSEESCWTRAKNQSATPCSSLATRRSEGSPA